MQAMPLCWETQLISVRTRARHCLPSCGTCLTLVSRTSGMLNSSFAIECWAYLDGYTENSVGQVILGTPERCEAGHGALFRAMVYKGCPKLELRPESRASHEYLPSRRWVHLAYTFWLNANRTKGTCSVFVDGKAVFSEEGPALTLPTPLVVGEKFNGMMRRAAVLECRS
jgi:hypothetical protein